MFSPEFACLCVQINKWWLPSKHAGIGPVLAEYRHVPAVPYTGERYWASAGPVPANHKLIQPMVVLAVR
jgi:hypothetical protein